MNNPTQALITMVILALAVSAVSVTVTKSTIFAGARAWVEDRNAFLGDLVHCPYCFSHWLAFAAVLVYRPRIVEGVFLVDMAVSAFALVALAAFSSGLVMRAFILPPPPPEE